MVNFPRNATQHLQSLFAGFPVVVVTGARQVGGHPLFGALFETAIVCEIRRRGQVQKQGIGNPMSKRQL